MLKFKDRKWFKPVGDGREKVDSKPMAIPAGFKRPETLQEQVARLVRTEEFRRAIGKVDAETFEEADDFDVEDDFHADVSSPFEMHFDPILGKEISPEMFEKNRDHYKRLYTDELMASDKIHKEAERLAKKVAKQSPSEPSQGDEPSPGTTPHAGGSVLPQS